eukprot:TRINITY_DN2198_c0_g1_i1.p1 TRINITY_DN2198_c0_g1~~TRINITY_DN2198_c0_g1_i1.p1  ORF type:complete len:108 (-),score=5.05 TRINITY_DN2198_c0_g1_i1:3-326(-)
MARCAAALHMAMSPHDTPENTRLHAAEAAAERHHLSCAGPHTSPPNPSCVQVRALPWLYRRLRAQPAAADMSFILVACAATPTSYATGSGRNSHVLQLEVDNAPDVM